jgi:methyl-accepting chemotaxis protein
MSNTNQIIMVGLSQAQWDVISSVLDGAHENVETTIKAREVLELTKEQVTERKEYCNDLVEIMDEIADQIAGITEMIEG